MLLFGVNLAADIFSSSMERGCEVGVYLRWQIDEGIAAKERNTKGLDTMQLKIVVKSE